MTHVGCSRLQLPALQLHFQVRLAVWATHLFANAHPVQRKLSRKKTLQFLHDSSGFKTTMKTSACAGRSRVFWSYTTMATRIYSCCRSPMPSSSCGCLFSLPITNRD